MALTTASLTGSVATSAANVVTGTGVFDDLMETVVKHLEAQFQLGRITGTDYATVYLGALQSAIQQAVSYTMEKTNSEVTLLNQKYLTEYVQTGISSTGTAAATSTMGKQQALYTEQAKGFQWNADQKYLKTLMDAWSINVSTAGVAATNVTAINATGTDGLNDQIAAAKPD